MATKRAKVNEESAKATLGAGGILDRIGDAPAAVVLHDLPIEQIHPNPFQPRQHFAPEALDELATAIRTHGFYGHLVVRRNGRSYELAYGERRLRSAKLAGLSTIPAEIRELTDNQMMEIALTENVLREDLHPVDEARAYLRLQETMGYSVRQIADRIGKSKSYVATMLSLLRYPDVEEAVRSADIPVRTAEELAKIEDPALRHHYLQQVVAGKLNREQLRDALTTERSPKTVRTADRNTSISAAIYRAYWTLQRQEIAHVQSTEKAEAVKLLQQIIEQARHLLERLEDE